MDRYDGPDIEGELGGRLGGQGMAAMMIAEGLVNGLASRKANEQAAAGEAAQQTREAAAAQREAIAAAREQILAKDRARFSAAVEDPRGLAGWHSQDLAQAWTAAARWPDQAQAGKARVAVEKELAERDPANMSAYQGLRACGFEPGEAMQQVLCEAHQQLGEEIRPLLSDPASLGEADLWRSWSAAEASHSPLAAAARAAAETQAAGRGGPMLDRLNELRQTGDLLGGGLVAAVATEAGFKPRTGHLFTGQWVRVAVEGVATVGQLTVAAMPTVASGSAASARRSWSAFRRAGTGRTR